MKSECSIRDLVFTVPRRPLNSLRLFLDNLRLQAKISLLVCLGLLGMLGIFGWLGVMAIRRTTDQILDERLTHAEVTASFVDTMLQETIYELSQAATYAPFDPDKGDLTDDRRVLSYIYGHIGYYTQGILELDRRGMVVLAEPANTMPSQRDMSAQPFVREAMQTGQSVISNAFRNPITRLPAVAIVVPVADDRGQIVSFILGIIDLDSPRFTRILVDAVQFAPSGHGDIVDGNGNVVVSSDRDDVLLPAEHPAFYTSLLAERSPAIRITKEDFERESHVMAFTPLKSAPWGLGLGATEEETFAPVWQEQNEVIVLAIVCLIVALIFAYLTTRRVVSPIEGLTAAAERIASGDLTRPIYMRGGDEIGRLAAKFDEMRSKLQIAHSELTIANSALTVEKSQYQGILHSMADPVFTVDLDLKVTALNPAALRMVGCADELEVIGLSCFDLLRSRDGGLPGCYANCPLVSSGPTDPASAQGPGHKPAPPVNGRAGIPEPATYSPRILPADVKSWSDQSVEVLESTGRARVIVDVTRAPILGDDGKMVGVVHVLRDISAKEELDRAKDRFIANVSHELRSPLVYIKGYASMLLLQDEDWGKRDRQKFLREIFHGSEKLQSLVDELLESSRLQAGAFSVSARPVKLRPIVYAAVRRARDHAKGCKLVVEIPRQLPAAQADPERTEQILRNLLENAIKYSPSGGAIVVSCSAADGRLVVSVCDSGIGIADDQLKRIFEPFHRVPGDAAIRAGGLGLGLSIARSIVEAQGGQIWAESILGSGSKFHFSIPIASG